MSTVTYTRESSFSGTWRGDVGVSIKTVEAKLGFSTTSASAYSKSFTIAPIPSYKKVNVKIFGNYAQYGYNVFTIFGNYKATGYAYVPMGLFVTQTTYSR